MSLAFAAVVARDPESRLLNMREKAELRDAHTPDIYRAGATYRGRCSCGVEFMPSPSAGTLHDAAQDHFSHMLEMAKGWKVSQAKARAELARIDAEIERALCEGRAAATAGSVDA